MCPSLMEKMNVTCNGVLLKKEGGGLEEWVSIVCSDFVYEMI